MDMWCDVHRCYSHDCLARHMRTSPPKDREGIDWWTAHPKMKREAWSKGAHLSEGFIRARILEAEAFWQAWEHSLPFDPNRIASFYEG